MTDYDDPDDYGGWEDYPERTDAEMLSVYVEDDAEDPDSYSLSYRQKKNWDEFQEKVERETFNSMKAFDTSTTPRKYPQPIWWELWTPPTVNGKPERRTNLLHQGTMSFEQELKTETVHSWGDTPIFTMPVSNTMYMHFEPTNKWDYSSLLLTPEGGRNYQKMAGDWGWWDEPHNRFRQIIYGKKIQIEPDLITASFLRDDPRAYTYLAVLMKAPPPYGFWLPALDLGRIDD